jgi:hypothetical protein
MAYPSLSALAESPATPFSGLSSAVLNDCWGPSPRGIPEVERLIESLVASWHASAQLLQNRRWHRTPYRKPLVITPMDHEADVASAGSRLATGRDLSAGGLSFLHKHPLPHRIVAITFGLEPDMPTAIVTRLTWCRFTRWGEYQSGGKFLRTIESPEVDLDALPMA